MLSVSRLTAGYGKLPVLHDVSLTVAPRSMVAVIGPNGAGKTTLMKSIVGLVNVMSGDIRFEGAPIGGMDTHDIAALGIGYVPQTRNVFASLTVQENLDLGCNLLPKGERGSVVAAVYERFPRLKQRQNQRGQSLSGGERQMLAIGSALLSRPRLLLLDEPVSGLSPHLTDEVSLGIKAINGAGTAVIWVVEENPRQVIALSDWVCVMDAGTVRASVPAAEILDAPNFRELFLGV
jgi:ABC-type branched-subunit amino acid transport system ATPase component